MNVLIVEDENLAAERLEGLIKKYDSETNILDSIDTVNDAAQFMSDKKDKLDLVFLDIQLADGKSFEIFQKIQYDKPVIFTTAYDEYALSAFKHNSIDYLLKPIKYEELELAIEKYKKLNSQSKSVLKPEIIEQLLTPKKKYKQRFLVKFGNKIQFKSSSEAALFSAEDKICHLHTYEAAKKYVVDHTLEELETQLLDPEEYFRISRKHILNINAIKEIKTVDSKVEVIPNFPYNSSLQVSRSKTSDFKSWIDR